MNYIAYYLWIIAFILIIISSIYFSFKLSFLQLNFKEMIRSFKSSNKDEISPLKSFLMGLAAKIGVGNIVAIAYAIFYAGPGTIFWMWVISLLASILIYIETYLGMKYRKKYNNIYFAGPNYYIKEGLKNNKLSTIYTILIILAYTLGFNSIQANTIAVNTSINSLYIGIALAIITFIIINKGIKKIINITSKMVPFMVFIYSFTCIIIILINIDKIGDVFKLIFSSAFNFKSIIDAINILVIGSKRAIFSNEAGVGTSSLTSCISDEDDYNKIGYMQISGVYITSIIISTLTAIVILLSNYNILNLTNINGIEIANYAFKFQLGNIGSTMLSLSILLFAYSTILSGYFYGESALTFLNRRKYLFIMKIIFVLNLFISSIIPSNFIWSTIDILTALLCIINIYTIYKFKDKIKR